MTHYKRLFWILTSATTLLRLSVIGRIGITVDEAHYWLYSQYLSLSYFDHPPLIGYIIRLFVDVFGTSEFSVRLPAVLFFVATSWLFYKCVQKLYDERTAFWSVVMINVLPVFSFLGAVISIPDSPLAFFWILTFYLFLKILETQSKNLWYALGLAVGLGLLAKYNAVMLPAGIFIFLLFYKKFAAGNSVNWLKRKEPYFAALIAFICFMPVIIWNMQNNWASFAFQLGRGASAGLPRFSFTLFGQSIGAQAGYVSPLLFLVFAACAYMCFKDAFFKRDKSALAIACFGLPVLLLFNAIATFNEILPHWPAMGYLVLTPYVTHIILKYWNVNWFRRYIYIASGLAILMNVLVPLQAMYKIIPIEIFLPAELRQETRHGISYAERIDLTNELHGWREVAAKIEVLVQENTAEGQAPFVFTHRSLLGGQLYFYSAPTRVYVFDRRITAFDFWQRDLTHLDGKNAIFVMNDVFRHSNPEIFPFDSFSEVIELPIYRNGRLIRKFWFIKAENFNLSAMPEQYVRDWGAPLTPLQALLKYDHAAFRFLNQTINNRFLNFIMVPISWCDYHNINIVFILMAIISARLLWVYRRKTFWTDVWFMVIVCLAGGTVIHILKDIFARPRPIQFFGQDYVSFFYERSRWRSFPSGHTQVAFSAAAYMAKRIPKFTWPLFIYAAFAGFARIYVGVHFLSDVIVGAIIGVVVAIFTTDLLDKHEAAIKRIAVALKTKSLKLIKKQ
ncbi:MAG: glycosyltransferase family 39 protein [Elusimicrobia bacterium]|nr:glycosyltransferase family 39 protein [Elusimicrobiota bacterium]